MKPIFCICIIFIAASCTEKKDNKKITGVTDTAVRKASKTDTIKDLSNVADNDSVIIAKFLKDSIATTVSGFLKEARQHVIILIDIKQGKNLSAILHTKKPVNIRINQIIMPDGKADGPFGNELNKPLLQQGLYKIIIGHNLMAEGSSATAFELRLIVK